MSKSSSDSSALQPSRFGWALPACFGVCRNVESREIRDSSAPFHNPGLSPVLRNTSLAKCWNPIQTGWGRERISVLGNPEACGERGSRHRVLAGWPPVRPLKQGGPSSSRLASSVSHLPKRNAPGPPIIPAGIPDWVWVDHCSGARAHFWTNCCGLVWVCGLGWGAEMCTRPSCSGSWRWAWEGCSPMGGETPC